MHATRWLATQVLSVPKRTPGVMAAKTCLVHLLASKIGNERVAAENALVWMVLHTRPVKSLSPGQRRTLLALPNVEGTDWAALVLDKNLIRPLLKQGRWWHRCRFAQSKFGFDFADEGVNIVWERIEKYRHDTGDFRGWLETVLRNYWISLHRKWKRSVPKGSDTAQALDLLAVGKDELWQKASENRTAPLNSAASAAMSVAKFSSGDIATMSRWEPIDGVLMGIETGVWSKIPRDLWSHWIKRLKLDPWGFAAMSEMTPSQRRKELAKITGIKHNTMAKRWQRFKRELSRLQFIANLLD